MRRNILIILVCVLMLSGCSTYHSARGGREYGDPHFCRGKDAQAMCVLGIGAAVVGAAVILSK